MKHLLLVLFISLSPAVYGLDKLTPSTSDMPNKHYVADSPTLCEAIRFTCADNEITFFDEKGCGCATSPHKHYLEQDPATCATLKFACAAQAFKFFDQYGCGCFKPPKPQDCTPSR